MPVKSIPPATTTGPARRVLHLRLTRGVMALAAADAQPASPFAQPASVHVESWSPSCAASEHPVRLRCETRVRRSSFGEVVQQGARDLRQFVRQAAE